MWHPGGASSAIFGFRVASILEFDDSMTPGRLSLPSALLYQEAIIECMESGI